MLNALGTLIATKNSIWRALQGLDSMLEVSKNCCEQQVSKVPVMNAAWTTPKHIDMQQPPCSILIIVLLQTKCRCFSLQVSLWMNL